MTRLFVKTEKDIEIDIDDNEAKQGASGSITPTTFKSREFMVVKEKNFQDATKELKKYGESDWLKNSAYEDIFEYNTGSGTKLATKHFGINILEPMVYTDIINTNTKSQKSPSSKKSKPAKLEDLKSYAANLTEIEKILVEQSISYLSSNTSEAAVVLDVLVRNDGKVTYRAHEGESGKVISKTDRPQTPTQAASAVHSVVLYKQWNKDLSKNQYLVIDPTTSEFSHILGGLVDKNIIVCNQKGVPVYTTPKSPKIGPNSDQFRDCTDIAVKIAFSLNFESSKGKSQQFKVDSGFITDMTDNYVVRSLSNHLDYNLPAAIGEIPSRAKQSSDLKVVRKMHAIFQVLNVVSVDLMKEKENHADFVRSHADFVRLKAEDNIVKIDAYYKTVCENSEQRILERILDGINLIKDVKIGENLETILLQGEVGEIDQLW